MGEHESPVRGGGHLARALAAVAHIMPLEVREDSRSLSVFSA